jgi:2-phospho-L-lactate guanylyltransferase (CobY/MobA/RfbA family)
MGSRNMSGISSTGSDFKLITVVPTLSTSQYASGDVMAVTGALAEACIGNGMSELVSVKVVDNDDKASDFDILILNANTSIGSANDAYNGADTVTDDIIDVVSVVAADYKDMINAQVAFLSATQADSGMGVVLAPAAAGGTSLYYALISRDTDTFSVADSLEITFAFKRH